jgi:hypothetical protein
LGNRGMSDISWLGFMKNSTDEEQAQNTLQSSQWAATCDGQLFK